MTQLPSRWQFETFGTQWSIETSRGLSGGTKRRVADRLEAFDKTYSRFRDDSIVARMRERAGEFIFPDDFGRLYLFYQELYELTNGKVTPLIGGLLEQAGYDKEYSMVSSELTGVPELGRDATWDGASTLNTKCPMTFDIGAAGKGYAVDLVAPFIEEETSAYVIDASGDLRHRGGTAERIGLEHPYDPSKVIGVANIYNQSLCASASNRRAWRGMHHIFDPRVKKPVDTIVATWVIADDTMYADGLATALFFVDSPAELSKRFAFEFVRMFDNGSVDYSPGFEGELFT